MWSDTQLEALQLLGYKRWIPRNIVEEALPPMIKTNVADFDQLRVILTAEERPPESETITTAQMPDETIRTIWVAGGEIECDEDYVWFRHRDLRFDWLFPPITGWIEEKYWLRPHERDFLFLALSRSGQNKEAEILKLLVQAVPPDQLSRQPITFKNDKKIMVLGQMAWRQLNAEQQNQALFLSHPNFAHRTPEHKKRLWLQIVNHFKG